MNKKDAPRAGAPYADLPGEYFFTLGLAGKQRGIDEWWDDLLKHVSDGCVVVEGRTEGGGAP